MNGLVTAPDVALASVAARPADWPADEVVHAAIARRLEVTLADAGDRLGEIARAVLAAEGRALAPRPATLWPLVVARSAASAGSEWRAALWPAVGLELAMAAADVLDDLADREPDALAARFGAGALVTAAAALVALAAGAVARAGEDGVGPKHVATLSSALAGGLAEAADGQIAALSTGPLPTDTAAAVDAAFRLAAAKSGPLGALAARLGATAAGADATLLETFDVFGWHLGVCSQLVNDARDAAPGAPARKRDVRDGAATVPLAFAGSRGAPHGLAGDALTAWEASERWRVVDRGGVSLAATLAHAEGLRAADALDGLERRGLGVGGLRDLLASFHRVEDVGDPGGLISLQGRMTP